jgi:EAL domain-containing protein (putative c-di-GMP-specific phosphodiesterase class I)
MSADVLSVVPTSMRLPDAGRKDLSAAKVRAKIHVSAAQAPELLDRLLRRGQIRVLFQPIFDITNNRILGYEALTRGPVGCLLEGSDNLFDCAESLGRLVELECLAVRTALKEFVERRFSGLLFLNVTRDALVEGQVTTLLASVSPARANTQVSASTSSEALCSDRIVLELCETRSSDELVLLAQTLAALRAHGMHLALDDFGVGYSCMRRWLQLRPSYIKVDQQFIGGIHHNVFKQTMLRAIVAIAAVDQCCVIAEGVEAPADLATLGQIGVGFAQGFLLGRPSQVAHTI